MKYINLKALLACAVVASLAGCGGKIEATIGGTVTGLSGGTTLVLQNNGGDNLNVTNSGPSFNGTFTFATQVEAGNTYDVTVLTQPTGETCYVENAYGTVEQSVGNVKSVAVVCNVTATASNQLTGSVTGVTSGQTLQMTIGGTNTATVNGNATGAPQNFIFPNTLTPGVVYTVSFTQVPTGRTCNFAGQTGGAATQVTIPTSGVPTPLSVTCQ